MTHNAGHLEGPVTGSPAVEYEPEEIESMWDERYTESDQMWSGEPNGALVAEVEGRRPGRAPMSAAARVRMLSG